MNDFNLNDIQALISEQPDPTGDKFLDTRYVESLPTLGHVQPYYRLFFQIAQLLKPGLVVELGGWQGTGAAHFASGGAGTVATIDHHTDPGDDIHRKRMLAAAQRYSNMFYFQGWTWDKVNEVKALGKRIDILFIDSWHVYDYAMRDWNDYSPMLASPALVICDDIMGDNGATIVGMQRFWQERSQERESFLSEVPHAGVPMGFIKWT